MPAQYNLRLLKFLQIPIEIVDQKLMPRTSRLTGYDILPTLVDSRLHDLGVLRDEDLHVEVLLANGAYIIGGRFFLVARMVDDGLVGRQCYVDHGKIVLDY